MKKTVIRTKIGDLTPLYDISDGRQKNRPSTEFFDSGEIYSVYLQDRTTIKTPVGDIPAEFVTFYKSGAVKRVFPLYGQLSGFWTEEQEYELATDITINLFGRKITVKPLCLYFYESGQLKSITIWSKERITVSTRYGDITTSLGLSFYEDGNLESIEPVLGSKITVPESEREDVFPVVISSDGKPNWNGGILYPFYARLISINADDNSLKFTDDGKIKSIRTVPLYRSHSL